MLKLYKSDILSRLCTAVMFLIVVSCANDNKVHDEALETYSLDDVEPGSISDLFSEVEIIDLKFDGKYYPKSVDRLVIDSGMIFIKNFNYGMYVFSENGTPLSSSLSMRGEGPGMHPIVNACSFNPYSGLMEIMTLSELIFYDKNFNFVKSSKLESRIKTKKRKALLYDCIYDLSANLHLLTTAGGSEKPRRFMVYDSAQEKNIGEISYEEDVWANINMQTNNFFVMPDSSIICHPCGLLPYTYQLDPKTLILKKIIKLETDSRCITLDEIKSLSRDGKIGNKLINYEKSIPLNTIVTPDKMIVMFKEGNNKRTFYTIAFDRKNGEKKEYRHYKDNRMVFPEIGYATGEYAYAVVDKDTLEESPELYLNNQDLVSRIDSIDDEDWVLLKYKYKTEK